MVNSDEFSPAIRRLQKDIAAKEAEVLGLKQTVNTLCGYGGLPPIYPNLEKVSVTDLATLRRDQFFGVPLATAVKDYLSLRGDPKSGGAGAATVNEIFSALKEGGFAFDAKNDENAKRGLRISLAKNVAAFRKVPGSGEGAFGLAEWYPAAKAPKEDDRDEAFTKRTDPEPEKEQGPHASSDESPTHHSDDSSEHQQGRG